MPNFALESAAGGRVAGVDEVGRGPLAGPVVAAAVVLSRRIPPALVGLLDDSKKLSPLQRETAFAALSAARAAGLAEIGVGAASVTEITRINILQASLLAMRRAVARLPAPPDLALVDGNRPPALACPVRCVVGGDGLCLSIAAASIVAKVVRDRGMARLALRYPGYRLGSECRVRDGGAPACAGGAGGYPPSSAFVQVVIRKARALPWTRKGAVGPLTPFFKRFRRIAAAFRRFPGLRTWTNCAAGPRRSPPAVPTYPLPPARPASPSNPGRSRH